jgi:hypothetical protein
MSTQAFLSYLQQTLESPELFGSGVKLLPNTIKAIPGKKIVGRFREGGSVRVFEFAITPKGATYKPVMAPGRADSHLMVSKALLGYADSRQATLMNSLIAREDAPKRCTGISYGCGNSCIPLKHNCRKGQGAIGKERLNKLMAFSMSEAFSEEGDKAEKTVSSIQEKRNARAQELIAQRRSRTPKPEVKPEPKPEVKTEVKAEPKPKTEPKSSAPPAEAPKSQEFSYLDGTKGDSPKKIISAISGWEQLTTDAKLSSYSDSKTSKQIAIIKNNRHITKLIGYQADKSAKGLNTNTVSGLYDKDGNMQSAAVHKVKQNSKTGDRYLYLEYLATAPWNLIPSDKMDAENRDKATRGAGAGIIASLLDNAFKEKKIKDSQA